MLTLDIIRVCSEKGISNPKKFLRGLGFYPNAAAAIEKGKRVRIDYDQIEKLCIALHCTPNDLFAWKPGENMVHNHPMNALIRSEKPSIPSLLRNLPPEKLDQLRELAMQLQNDESIEASVHMGQ